MENCTDLLGSALTALRDCASAALKDCEREAQLIFLAPGASVSWDNCCEGGGQMWVRVVNITPQPTQSQVCDIDSNLVRLGVGVIRCMHGLTDDGFPTAEQMTEDTLGMTKDAVILQNAIKCCTLPASVYRKTMRFEQGVPLGPQGTCGGWEWTITFKQGICGGC